MKKFLSTTMVLWLTFLNLSSSAQSNKCASAQILEQRIAKDPSVLLRMAKLEEQTQMWIANNAQSKKAQSITKIPVVVHVLYKTATENISTNQIQSQIDILNEDFRQLNPDSLTPSHPFWNFTADAGIEFCLATRDPYGNPTTGIIRTYTDSSYFSSDETNMKFTSTGGKNNWDPTKYLNIWVCNLTGLTLGFATFPSDLVSDPNQDGVVCRHQCFGNIGTAGTGGFTNNNGGRTMTHEVGHWLNLRHIWGDNQPSCGDDFVADTKPADHPNYGCETFPHHASNPCGTNSDGEMFMNYMDYSDDNCLVMFTVGQANRMIAALNGPRVGLLSSNGCTPVGINEFNLQNTFNVYPNPSDGDFNIRFNNYTHGNITINVVNLLGATIKVINSASVDMVNINLSELDNGVYYLQIISNKNTSTKKIFVIK